MATITLLSDFGLTDPYVAEMKGVILSNNPDLKIVDVSHGIERHNIAMGSFILETALPYFPQGSINVAVVDPGVGTERLPLVVLCKLGVLVGPDNGLLVRAAERLGFKAAYQIDSRRFKGEKVSATFHGRDVFARMAANLADGLRPDTVGAVVKELVRLDIPSVGVSDEGMTCTILHVDSFGNVILNLGEQEFLRLGLHDDRRLEVKTMHGRSSASMARTYWEIRRDGLGIILGSQGYVELAMRESSAAARLGLKPLDKVEIRF
ncbi:MAG TPA: SAM-dependent chlorinase/fluorinase [Candidatus Bathyarchaeia archaeon]|nr:SAM-dependent chlorinase/fluorinase [Candidatus Bathyarchaeia archaeon]